MKKRIGYFGGVIFSSWFIVFLCVSFFSSSFFFFGGGGGPCFCRRRLSSSRPVKRNKRRVRNASIILVPAKGISRTNYFPDRATEVRLAPCFMTTEATSKQQHWTAATTKSDDNNHVSRECQHARHATQPTFYTKTFEICPGKFKIQVCADVKISCPASALKGTEQTRAFAFRRLWTDNSDLCVISAYFSPLLRRGKKESTEAPCLK